MSSGRERPAAIVVEDLHWADAETLVVLDALVDGAGASRLLVIVSYRPEHRHEWGGKTYYRQIPIDALAARDTAILLDRLLGSGPSLAPVKQMLAERTGGNPFFLEESVCNLVESGALIGERSAYRVARLPSATDVPATVFSVVAALEARRESETDGRDVDRLAHHAMRGEIWDKAVLYSRTAGQLALSRHAHRVAAAYFEQAIAALAHVSADTPSTAVAIDLRLELRYALGPLGEYRRVFELLTEAKQLAETAMEKGRLGLISCLLCNQATLRFELSQALAHGAQALEIAATLGDGALATATHGMMSLPYFLSGDYRRGAEAGRQVEGSEGDMWRDRFGLVVPPPVYGASVGSWALAELGEFAEAHRMSSRGLATAEKLNHPHSIAFACLGLGIVQLRQGASTAAVAVLERAVNLCETGDLPTVFLEIAGPLASAYTGAGRAAEAIALLERAVAQAVILRHSLGHALRSGSMAEALLASGRIEDAAPLAKLYAQFARAANTKGPLAWALHLLASVA